jgi:hypothetical protein
MSPEALIGAVVVPAVVAFALLAAARALRARWPWLGTGAPVALALAVAVALGARSQFSGLPWPPAIALESLPWAVLVAAAVAAAVPSFIGGELGRVRPVHAAAALPATVVPFLAAWLVLQVPRGGFSAATHAGMATVVAISAVLAGQAARSHGVAPAIGMWATGAALAGMALAASVAKLALIAGAFSAGAAAVGVLALLQRPLAMGAPAAAVWAVTIGVGCTLGAAYDEQPLPRIAWWLLAASPAASALACLPALAQRPRARAVALALGPAVVALAALAIVGGSQLASPAQPSSEEPSGYESLSRASASD